MVGVFELLQQGRLPARGFVGQEQVSLRQFLATQVGHYYKGFGVASSATRPARELAHA